MGLPALPRTQIGWNADGTKHFNYDLEGVECVVATGPSMGLVQLADGTTYDVTDHYIAIDGCDGHDETGKPVGTCPATEVVHHIALQIERTGRLDTTDPETGEPIIWQHTDCPHCDVPKTLHLPRAADRTLAARGKPVAAPPTRRRGGNKAGA